MKAIKEFLVKLWGNIGEYVKIHFAGLLVVIVAFVLLSLWLLPKEKQEAEKVSAKYDQIAKNYDDNSGDYKNTKEVTALQNQVEEIKSEGQITKLFKVAFISFVLVTLSGFLGNFLQYIYTVVPFSDLSKNTDNLRVLSTALLSASLIVCFVFAMVFWI